MRIISGQYKGRRITLPKGVTARPTSDRIRESLFSVLHNRIQASRVLDLFAGSGLFGMECLSRGASYATFCDKDRRSARNIASLLETFGVETSSYDVNSMDYERLLERLTARGEQYDLVYIDPPYQSDYYEKALTAMDELLADDGLVLCETERRKTLPETVGSLKMIDRRVYGNTAICIYDRER